MSRLPLRSMMLIPTVFAIAVGFAAFAVYIDQVEQNNLIADIDDELVRAERSAAVRPSSTEDQPSPPPVAAGTADNDPTGAELAGGVEPPVQLVLGPDGGILTDVRDDNPFTDPTLIDLAGRSGTFTIDDPRYRVRVTPQDDATVAITALSLERLDQSVADFRQTLLGGGLVILSLLAAVVWILTSAMIRPVTRMAATATRIADGALDTKIDPPSGSRETAELAVDLDRMLNRLRSTIDDREQSATEATQARDNMQRFLADMSHELRTPLTALKGYSELYAGHMLDEPGALDRAMARIGNESERLHDLVNDMLQLARQAPPADQTELVDACDIVQVVVVDLRAAHPEIRIDLDVAPDTDGMVSGWPSRLHQAVLNVGSNACQYTEPGGGVQVDVRSSVTSLVIQIIDHGPGIDPNEVDKVFLPFYRHETSRGRDGRGGAGLGLAITNQIVGRHNGTIAVGTTSGGGATFTLTIPLATQ